VKVGIAARRTKVGEAEDCVVTGATARAETELKHSANESRNDGSILMLECGMIGEPDVWTIDFGFIARRQALKVLSNNPL
jgi:hypothetical protein